jgi:anti-sigma factor RsiW
MSMNPECTDKSLLMAYLYGECDAGERESFERHLGVCDDCRREAQGLRGVRDVLEQWTPPETALGFRVVRDEVSAATAQVLPFTPRAGKESASRRMPLPAWAQLAAAVLVLAVGAAIANLDVRVGNGGVTVRTGWQAHASDSAAASKGATPAGEPWRADLAKLEQNLRRDMSARNMAMPLTASAPAGTTAGAARGLTSAEAGELLRRVDDLVAQSARRQRQEFENLLATRMVQFGRDIDAQRRADLVRIQQGFGQNTSELTQLREMQKYLVNRVANIQEIK